MLANNLRRENKFLQRSYGQHAAQVSKIEKTMSKFKEMERQPERQLRKKAQKGENSSCDKCT